MLIFMFHNILPKAHFWVLSKDTATPLTARCLGLHMHRPSESNESCCTLSSPSTYPTLHQCLEREIKPAGCHQSCCPAPSGC